jgi:predicted dehydrogenase
MTGITRRNWLASAAAPLILPASARGANDRIVMGFIGVGGQGGGHLRSMVRQSDVRVSAICDVMANRRNSAKDLVDSTYRDNSCKTYNDFRELLARPDIDAVLMAVPDHWHVLIGLEAARRGKHQYFEKPMGVSVAESQAMRAAVKRYGIVFQFGTQQRSSATFRHAVELVRNKRIGELKEIVIGSANSQYVPNQPEQPVPEGFDYEMWLGPAPWKPYTAERVTRNWTLIYDYSLGCISGAWGVHDVDTAQWAIDADHTGPVEVEGEGEYPADGLYDTAVRWEIHHTYANGVKLIHTDIRSARKRWTQFAMGNMASLFLGTEGWIYVSRQTIRTHPESLVREKFGPNAVRVIHSNDHRRNFLDAVRTGAEPISPIEAAVRADTVCQQADIAMRLRRKLRWDPVAEKFVGDEQANRMLSRPMRSPWHL